MIKLARFARQIDRVAPIYGNAGLTSLSLDPRARLGRGRNRQIGCSRLYTRYSRYVGAGPRLGYLPRGVQQEVTMVDLTRRARLVRELEQEFVPDYDAQSMPSADKRAAYALEHLAFRVGRIEQLLARIAAAIETALPKP